MQEDFDEKSTLFRKQYSNLLTSNILTLLLAQSIIEV